MTDNNGNGRPVSRRTVLTGTKLALGAAIAAKTVSQAQAQPTFKQADVMYQTKPKDDQRCGLAPASRRPMPVNSSKAPSAPPAGASCSRRRGEARRSEPVGQEHQSRYSTDEDGDGPSFNDVGSPRICGF
jgi:hypothetical protein